MAEIKTIAYDTAKDFLLPRHYSGRTPSISHAYGCYNNKELVGVLTVGVMIMVFIKTSSITSKKEKVKLNMFGLIK